MTATISVKLQLKENRAVKIRKSTDFDKSEIETVHIQAFGEEEGPDIAKLVNDLFEDETAFPLLSLVAVKNGKIVGHVLYTKAIITQTTKSVSAQILAPLGILPEAQNQGIGAQLIREGLNQLKESGVELVFVLGHQNIILAVVLSQLGFLDLKPPIQFLKKMLLLGWYRN